MKFLGAEVDYLRVAYFRMRIGRIHEAGVTEHRGNTESVAHRRNQQDQNNNHQMPRAGAGDEPCHLWPERLAVYFKMIEQTARVSKIKHLNSRNRPSL